MRLSSLFFLYGSFLYYMRKDTGRQFMDSRAPKPNLRIVAMAEIVYNRF